MTQVTAEYFTHHDQRKEKGAVCILSLGQQDGELKVLEVTEFSDPQKDEFWCQ